jgi:TolB-like protein/tetratricopeptide (TPR) repeat protein
VNPDLRAQLQSALADRYTLERELGRGGMATVYLAQDLKHDRPVALKVLHPELAASLGPERFLREIKLAARLQHPHIMTVLDSGESAGHLWFTMPYIEGESLRDRLTRERQLPIADAVRLTREAALALDFAHRQGVVHRDIKPENILLVDGQALVADFGIARAMSGGQAGGRSGGQADREAEPRLTETGVSIGTPAYMSPEQSVGDKALDARTDIYSLGTVLYEMLAGETPFSAPSAQAMIARRITETPRPLHQLRETVPDAVAQAVTRALAKAPADRFATAAEFARALDPATTAATAPVRAATTEDRPQTPTATTTTVTTPSPPPALLRRPLTLALALGFLLGLGVLFGWIRSRGGAEPAGPGTAKLLAVLPFENLGDASDEYFADGITDEVRGKLATLPGLQVIAGSSAGQYKRSTKSPRQIAQELGVQYLLIGKIRWEKGAGGQSRVRVSPELVQVAGGGPPTTKWQQPFDASLTDVFQVQADIAGRVAQALDVALGAQVQQQLAEKPTQNLAAYDVYLKGVEAFSAGAQPATLRQALGYFEQAVALDTAFATAWARLSQAGSLLNGVSAPSPTVAARSRLAAERALALAPDRPEGHVALGDYYRRIDQDNARALDAYGRGQRLAPSSWEVLRGTGLAEQALGRWDASLAHLQQAHTLDPRSVATTQALTTTLVDLRRYPEAREAADRGLAVQPGSMPIFEWKVMSFLAEGDLPAARQLVRNPPKAIEPAALVVYIATYYDLSWVLEADQQELLLRLGPEQFDGDRGAWGLALADVYRLRGDHAHARAFADSARIALEDQIRTAPQDAGLHVYLGMALAYLGHKADAIAESERGVVLLPIRKNAINGPYYQHQLARTYILVGEPDKAIDQLEPLLRIPYYLSPAWLRIDPTFDPLRSNPRFQRLVAATP